MSAILFIISAILFQLPLSFYQDTIRRFKNLETYNPVKAFDYTFENGNLNDNKLLLLLVFLSGFILSLIPLIIGIKSNWIILVIVNILCLYFVTPFIAFRLYPKGMIYTTKILMIRTILFIIFGFIFLFVANSFR